MILPSKNSNLNISPIYVGSVILNDMRSELGEFCWLITQQALNIIFLAGKVKYIVETDDLEILK